MHKSVLIVAACTALIASSCGSNDAASEDTTPDDTASADTAPEDSASEDSASESSTEAVADSECPPLDGSSEKLQTFDGPPPNCLDPDASYQAVVVTNKGEFTIELDAESAPVTTNSFVFLARNQYFDNTECHRIIPGFVVQCGDPTASGTGGPGYVIVDELPDDGEYQIGSIAMANAGPGTSGSQFFIITGEQGAALPPLYSLFGEVVEGFDGTVVQLEAAGTGAGTPSEPIEIQSITIIQS